MESSMQAGRQAQRVAAAHVLGYCLVHDGVAAVTDGGVQTWEGQAAGGGSGGRYSAGTHRLAAGPAAQTGGPSRSGGAAGCIDAPRRAGGSPLRQRHRATCATAAPASLRRAQRDLGGRAKSGADHFGGQAAKGSWVGRQSLVLEPAGLCGARECTAMCPDLPSAFQCANGGGLDEEHRR